MGSITFCRVPSMPFTRRRNRVRDGDAVDIKDKGGVP